MAIKRHVKRKAHAEEMIPSVRMPESSSLTNMILSLAIILVIILVYSIYVTTSIGQPPKVDKPDLTVTYILDSKCTDCADISALTQFLEQYGNVDTKSVEFDSSAGKKLISKYSIEKVPSAVVTGDLSKVPDLKTKWNQFGLVSADALVLLNTPSPYLNITSGNVQGLVEITYLADKSCTECYNPLLHKQALASLGITKFSKETSVDVSSDEGKALVSKYKIKAAPTIILSSGAAEYPGLVQVWPSVGTIESDGSFVFRTMSAIKGVSYKDLTTGEVVGTKNATAP